MYTCIRINTYICTRTCVYINVSIYSLSHTHAHIWCICDIDNKHTCMQILCIHMWCTCSPSLVLLLSLSSSPTWSFPWISAACLCLYQRISTTHIRNHSRSLHEHNRGGGFRMLKYPNWRFSSKSRQVIHLCCSVLQYVVMCDIMFQCVAVCCCALQHVY